MTDVPADVAASLVLLLESLSSSMILLDPDLDACATQRRSEKHSKTMLMETDDRSLDPVPFPMGSLEKHTHQVCVS